MTVGQLVGPLLSIGADKTEQFRKSKLGVVLEKFFLGIRNFRNFGLVSVVGLSNSATVTTGARALNDKINDTMGIKLYISFSSASKGVNAF